MRYATVNGTQVEAAQAVVSVDDRGFRYGDGVFETVRVLGGLPYLWDYHMARLSGGLRALRIKAETSDLLPQVLALLGANDVRDGLLRIQVSRGAGGRGYLPGEGKPTVVLQTLTRPAPPAPVTLWLSSYKRIQPTALPVHFKLAQGLNSILARMEAEEHGCGEALLLGASGHISEASSANLFWRRNDTLYTPSLETGALAGVMRLRLLELSPWPVAQGLYSLSDMMRADAVILTNAASGAVAAHGLLMPQKRWESDTFAREINTLIDSDLIKSTAALRESLASG